jgi:hypothetical protein
MDLKRAWRSKILASGAEYFSATGSLCACAETGPAAQNIRAVNRSAVILFMIVLSKRASSSAPIMTGTGWFVTPSAARAVNMVEWPDNKTGKLMIMRMDG